MRLIFSCQDRPPIWISSTRVPKVFLQLFKQKQSQKEGASYTLLALQSPFLHKKSHNFRVRWIVQGRNEVMSSTKVDTFRGLCWQIVNPTWHCNFLPLMNCHKAPEERVAYWCYCLKEIPPLFGENYSGLRNSALAESTIWSSDNKLWFYSCLFLM